MVPRIKRCFRERIYQRQEHPLITEVQQQYSLQLLPAPQSDQTGTAYDPSDKASRVSKWQAIIAAGLGVLALQSISSAG